MKKFISILCVCLTFSLWSSEILVLNSNSQTLSKIDLSSEEINNNFASLGDYTGSAPNKFAVTDNYIYSVITYENAVQKTDLETGNTISYIFLEDSCFPNDIAISGSYAYVTGNNSFTCYKVDLSNDEIVGNIDVGKAPQGLIVAGDKLFVANTGYNASDYTYDPGAVSVIDLNTFTVIDTLNTDYNPTVFSIVDNNLHVACQGDWFMNPGKINVFNLDNLNLIQTIDIGGSPGALTANQGKAFVGHAYPAGISVYNLDSYAILSEPSDNLFVGGGALVSNNEILIVVDAGDYVNSSHVRVYGIENYELIHDFEVGVGATDVKFAEQQTPNNDVSNAQNFVKCKTYPNPFSNKLNIELEGTSRGSELQAVIFNIKGQQVNQMNNINRSFTWNGTDSNGKTCANGIYFMKIMENNQVVVGKKVMLVK